MTRFLPLAAALGASVAMAQNPEEGFRQLWNTELLKKRPAAAAPTESKKSSEALNKKAEYKRVSPPVVVAKKDPASKKDPVAGKDPATTKPSATGTETVVGVTLWRLRPVTAADQKDKRLLVLPKGPNAKVGPTIPERIPANSPVAVNEMVRLSVEVPRTGYLYIIDREVYADGTMSEPYLIYPNHLTRPGDNLVAAGRVLQIPDPRDTPNHFLVQVSQTGKRQVAEQFSILVTPKPLGDNMKAPEGDALKISEAQYKEWEQKYFVESESWELSGGDGKEVTLAETEAGAGSGKLSQNDALPQTLYKINCEPDRTILIKVPVKIKQ